MSPRLRTAVARVMHVDDEGVLMVQLTAEALMRAQDVRLVERADYPANVVHVEAQDPAGQIIAVRAHPSQHADLVEMLDAWREAREAVAMGRPPCSHCGGRQRVWVRTDAAMEAERWHVEAARAHFARFGVRVLRFHVPIVEIPCPCPCHKERANG